MTGNENDFVKQLCDQINNEKTPLGTIISPSGIEDGYMLLRNENKQNPKLLKSLVCFSMNDSPNLASISSVTTKNPFMDFQSPLGMGNMSFIANRGKVPHTEDSDMRYAEIQFLTKLDKSGNREQLMTSPDIGLKVVEADEKILKTFYPFDFPNTISIGRYLGRELPVPLDVFQLKSVHCGVFGETGWGKSILQAFLAATLVRANCKLLIFDHSGDYSNDGTEVNKIFSKLVGKKNKDYKVFNANEIRADHDLLRIKLKDRDFWDFVFQTTEVYADKLGANIVDIIEEKYPEISDLQNLDGGTFYDIVLQGIENSWSKSETITDKKNVAAKKQKKIVQWFVDTIQPYITRPSTFTDVKTSILSQKAVIIDLSGEHMDDDEKALYVAKIGDIVLAEGNKKYPKEKLNLVTIVDEAHIYVPQSIKNVKENRWISKSKKTITEITKQGRKYGLGLCLADQRITAVDKQAIDMGTYFLGKLKMSGDRNHVQEMFGKNEAEALRTIQKFQFLVVGNASPLEDVTAPISVFNPENDLEFVEKLHS